MVQIDCTNTARKLRAAARAYSRIFHLASSRGVPIGDLLRAQFSHLLPDAQRPPCLSVELTNHCNVQCAYCVRPNGSWPRGYMSDETLANLVTGLRKARISRVRLIGNGEATMHPKLGEFAREIKSAVPMLSICTNIQWRSEEVPRALLDATVDLIELSIDAGGRETYERSKRGASFDRMMRNLQQLRRLRQQLGAPSLINIRLLVRPSQEAIVAEEVAHWSQLADTVMPQQLLKTWDDTGPEADLYIPIHTATHSCPQCVVLHKHFVVHWNGDVPLCNEMINILPREQIVIGNVNRDSLIDIWRHPARVEYMKGHRSRNAAATPLCEGCRGY